MKQIIVIATILAVIAILIGVAAFATVWAQDQARQRATEQQIADLRRQVEQKPAPATPAAPIVINNTPAASPVDSPLERERLSREVLTDGWNLVDQGSPDAATRAVLIFQQGIDKVDPRNGQFYNGLGRALLVAHKPVEAIRAWRRGLAVAPTIADMQSGIGWAYWNLHDPYHAKQAWEAALAIDPKSVDAWSAMAWIYLALGDHFRARDGFVILYAADKSRDAVWIQGISMSKAGNHNPDQIQQFFKLPPLEAFRTPPAVDPAEAPASAPTTAPAE